MERSYDEIIADMLIQLDAHSRELTKQSQKSDRIHQEFLLKFKEMEKIDNQLTEQLVHSATILDRIIKNNDLKI